MSNSPREIEPSERALDKPAQSVAAGRPESGFFQRLRDVARPGLMYAVPPVVVLALVGVSWEIWTRISNTPEYIVPAPTKVVARLVGDIGFFAGHGAVTLGEAIAGFLLGAAVALVGATLMAHSRVIERSLFPLAILVKVTPGGSGSAAVRNMVRVRADPEGSDSVADHVLSSAGERGYGISVRGSRCAGLHALAAEPRGRRCSSRSGYRAPCRTCLPRSASRYHCR